EEVRRDGLGKLQGRLALVFLARRNLLAEPAHLVLELGEGIAHLLQLGGRAWVGSRLAASGSCPQEREDWAGEKGGPKGPWEGVEEPLESLGGIHGSGLPRGLAWRIW